MTNVRTFTLTRVEEFHVAGAHGTVQTSARWKKCAKCGEEFGTRRRYALTCPKHIIAWYGVEHNGIGGRQKKVRPAA